MKKVFVILSVFVLAIAGEVSAQAISTEIRSSRIAKPLAGDRPSESISLNFTKVEGPSTIPLSNGRGSLKLVVRGDRFSDVVYTDAAGKSTRLVPIPGGTAGAPKTECKYPIPDACFGTADKSIGLCMCRPTNLSAAGSGDPTAILIGLLLPAVQKVREAGHR